MTRAIAIAALALAIVASVFAIWPVVADAPWEDSPAPVFENRTDEIRCEGALRLREVATEALAREGLRGAQTRRLEDQLEEAQSEIRSYCR